MSKALKEINRKLRDDALGLFQDVNKEIAPKGMDGMVKFYRQLNLTVNPDPVIIEAAADFIREELFTEVRNKCNSKDATIYVSFEGGLPGFKLVKIDDGYEGFSNLELCVHYKVTNKE